MAAKGLVLALDSGPITTTALRSADDQSAVLGCFSTLQFLKTIRKGYCIFERVASIMNVDHQSLPGQIAGSGPLVAAGRKWSRYSVLIKLTQQPTNLEKQR